MLSLVMLLLWGETAESSGNQCYKSNSLPDMYRGMKVNESIQPFMSMSTSGPLDCGRNCKLHALCSCVNFHIPTSNCELLAWKFDVGALVTDTQFLTIDALAWTGRILGVCENHICPNNTVCKVGRAKYYCEPIGCAGAPHAANVNVTTFTKKALWTFGEMVEYPCLRGYFIKTNVTCQADGQWSGLTCSYFSVCGQTGMCEPRQSIDYWLYSTHLQSLYKIFCRSIDPRGPFLSLTATNMASFPAFTRLKNSCEPIEVVNVDPEMGSTEFWKIRMVPNRPKIDHQIIFNHYLNTTMTIQKFGRAGDCYAGNDSSACGAIGRFLINTQGTGMRVKSSVQWKTWGVNGVIMNITRSADGHVIEGFCGGNCGGCEPDGDLILEIDPKNPPSLLSAEPPICKFPL